MGKSTINGQFSIAMLVCQRVQYLITKGYHLVGLSLVGLLFSESTCYSGKSPRMHQKIHWALPRSLMYHLQIVWRSHPFLVAWNSPEVKVRSTSKRLALRDHHGKFRSSPAGCLQRMVHHSRMCISTAFYYSHLYYSLFVCDKSFMYKRWKDDCEAMRSYNLCAPEPQPVVSISSCGQNYQLWDYLCSQRIRWLNKNDQTCSS